MGVPFLEQDTGSGLDITSEAQIGEYTASSDRSVGASFRISSMNGAAATLTMRLAHTSSGDTLIRNWYFSKAKHTAANTVFGDEFPPVAVKSGEKLKLYALSSNSNDTSVTWATDWITISAVLPSDGLDSIDISELTGVAANFAQMMVQLWRRFFKKATLTSTQLKTYKNDGSTVVTTQTVSDTAGTQTQDAAS